MKNLCSPALALLFTLLFTATGVLFAQEPPIAVDPAPQEASPAGALLSPAQLDSLVAPIALYPDPLLSQVLVASTYPLEIVQAAQWLRQNPSLSGAAAQSAASSQNWDPSVQALVLFPDVLFRMADDSRWTNDLGNAFLAQQSGVMDAVQHLRSEAMDSGKLASNPAATITTQTQGDSSAVQIQPANPNVIYVPNYDPATIWGPQVNPYPFAPYSIPDAYGNGLMSYGPGIFVGSIFAGLGGWTGWGGWGWMPNWFGHGVTVNNGFFSRYGYNRFGLAGGILPPGLAGWVHNPMHRANVPYGTRAVAAQFHSVPLRSMASIGAIGSMAARPVMPAVRSMASVASFPRLASPAFASARPAANPFAALPTRGFQAPRSYSAPGRNAVAMNYRSAPGVGFSSTRSHSAPAMRSATSASRSFARSSGGQAFARSSGGSRSVGGHSGGGHSGSGHGGGGHSSGGHSGHGRHR
jgi:hypothetical protein